MARLIPPVPYRLTIGTHEDRDEPEPLKREPLRLTGPVPLKVDDGREAPDVD
ncbi:hypothetical protein [Nocardia abscessus]|uniref:hypothetical protein n=1 Tax=Nocardia abscessus TaxID=120957 RepID=UPI0024578BEA|nr:hypothetical protein [Nocardia abscessus]